MQSSMKVVYHLDDDPDIHLPVQMVCQKRLNLEHHSFTTVESFLKRIKEKAPDLCIVDINLMESVGAGFAVIQAIRNKFSGTMPILVVSRRSSSKDVSIALEVGASDFLPKPIDFSLLIEKITYLLEGAEQNAFPFKKIIHELHGELEFHLKPTLIDEVYIHMESSFYVLRSTPIRVKHEIINTIFGKPEIELIVHDCRLQENESTFSLRLIQRDPSDEYFDKIQRFLLSKI